MLVLNFACTLEEKINPHFPFPGFGFRTEGRPRNLSTFVTPRYCGVKPLILLLPDALESSDLLHSAPFTPQFI